MPISATAHARSLSAPPVPPSVARGSVFASTVFEVTSESKAGFRPRTGAAQAAAAASTVAAPNRREPSATIAAGSRIVGGSVSGPGATRLTPPPLSPPRLPPSPSMPSRRAIPGSAIPPASSRYPVPAAIVDDPVSRGVSPLSPSCSLSSLSPSSPSISGSSSSYYYGAGGCRNDKQVLPPSFVAAGCQLPSPSSSPVPSVAHTPSAASAASSASSSAAAAMQQKQQAQQIQQQQQQQQQQQLAAAAGPCILPDVGATVSSAVDTYHVGTALQDTVHGRVMLAWATRLKSVVVLKLSIEESVRSGWCSERPEQEEKLLRYLNHLEDLEEDPLHRPPRPRRIVQLFDTFSKGGVHYSVLEYCCRGDLFDELSERLPLPEPEARWYMKRICEAVRFIHKANVCHLDLSLENIVVTDRHELRLCDFGIARDVSRGHVVDTEPAGKPEYTAPEIVNQKPYDCRLADVYSLGHILFILVYGGHAYHHIGDAPSVVLLEKGFRALLRAYKLSNFASAALVDLLSGMLCYEKGRISLDQVLNHPWMTGQAASSPSKSADRQHHLLP